MNNIDIARGIVFQKLEAENDTFDARLICQKKVYLLQTLGTELGYVYNWYVRGPYSPMLSSYLYANLDILKSSDYSNYKLSKQAEANINIVNKLKECTPQDLQVTSWYELLASVLYISNNKDSWKVSDKEEEIIDTLMKHKPQYNREQCEKAFGALNGYNNFIKVGA